MSVFCTLVARGIRETKRKLDVAYAAWRSRQELAGEESSWESFYYIEGSRLPWNDGLGTGQRLERAFTQAWQDELKLIHSTAQSLSAQVAQPRWWILTVRGKPGMPLPVLVKVANKVLAHSTAEDVKLAFEQAGESESALGTGAHFHAVIALPRKTNKAQLLQLVVKYVGKCAHIDGPGIHVEAAHNPQRFIDEYLAAHTSADGHKEPKARWDAQWRLLHGLQPLYEKGERVVLEQARLQEDPLP